MQLVIHHVDAAGVPQCGAYDDLSLANPVLVVLADYASPTARAHSLALFAALDRELRDAMGATPVEPPCGGSRPAIGDCQMRSDAAADKVLVLVGDTVSASPPEITVLSDDWAAAASGHSILPLFPLDARPSLSRLLPPSARHANAVFWQRRPDEALPALFARAAISAEQPRLFISYRQIDSAALAIQLFDAFSHEGFDVFLDHFRIPPGANFQARLTQELGDKSMVLLLESEHLGESEWVAHEIGIAKSCGLGLLGLLLPRGRRQPSLDEGNRDALIDDDFEGGRFTSETRLTADALGRVVAGVRTRHDRTLVARRKMLEQSFEGALAREGCAASRFGNGAIEVRSAGREYRVWLTSRPPEMPDFHRAHGAVSPPTTGVVVGLSRLMEPAHHERTAWLADLCRLELADEGQLSDVARAIAAGTL